MINKVMATNFLNLFKSDLKFTKRTLMSQDTPKCHRRLTSDNSTKDIAGGFPQSYSKGNFIISTMLQS